MLGFAKIKCPRCGRENRTKLCNYCRQSDWIARNPERARAQREKYYRAHKAKMCAQSAAWAKAHPEIVNARQKKYFRKWKDELTDTYVRSTLIANGTGLHAKDIPSALIATQRVFLKLKRAKWKNEKYESRTTQWNRRQKARLQAIKPADVASH